nr:YfiR/HmsC family protein [Roseomonas sp. GC11]
MSPPLSLRRPWHASGPRTRRGALPWRPLLLLLALALQALPHRAARAAEPSLRDLQVLARSLGFLEPAPRGLAEIGIVYAAGDSQGEAEARRIATLFGEGLRAGNLQLRPILVPLDRVRDSRAAALLLARSALPQAPMVAAAVAGRAILTVATDRAPIEQGLVAMAIRSEPRVEIVVNRAAAQASGVTFAAAFRMMIQER